MSRVFCDPEFLRTVQYVPFDEGSDIEARRHDERQATLRFAYAREMEEAGNAARGILAGAAICLVGWSVAIWWCVS